MNFFSRKVIEQKNDDPIIERLDRLEKLILCQGNTTAESLGRLEAGVDNMGGLMEKIGARVDSVQSAIAKMRSEFMARKITGKLCIFLGGSLAMIFLYWMYT